MMMCSRLAIALALFAAAATAHAGCDSHLEIGSKTEPSSLHPLFVESAENLGLTGHIFDALFSEQPDARWLPSLAQSAVRIGPDRWELRLRRDVVFHNGAPFTARDVLFTIRNVPRWESTPLSLSKYTRNIARMEIVDQHTIRMTTTPGYQWLERDLSYIPILSEQTSAGVDASEFTSPATVIGTGPYVLRTWLPADRIVLSRFERYHGAKAAWKTVSFRPITSNATRVAALLAGDVDLIDQVPIIDLPRIRGEGGFGVTSMEENRSMFLQLDVFRDRTPHATDRLGRPIPNPLRDPRVREALFLAIDRDAIIDRILGGAGRPAATLLPAAIQAGHTERTPRPRHDPERARNLLARAGYPHGFRLTLHGSNNRYPLDSEVLQAVGQMFTRAGIETRIEALPRSVFFTAARRHEYSAMLVGYGTVTYADFLEVFYTTGGAANRGRYSNPHVDALVVRANREPDPQARAAAAARAQEILLGDYAVILLYFPKLNWAFDRSKVIYRGFPSDFVRAAYAEPVCGPVAAGSPGRAAQPRDPQLREAAS